MFFLKPLTGSEDFETGAIDQQMNRTIREDNVRLPRRRRPASYSAQFFTWNFILGMWWRREELCLLGIEGVAFQKSVPDLSQTTRFLPYSCNNAPQVSQPEMREQVHSVN